MRGLIIGAVVVMASWAAARSCYEVSVPERMTHQYATVLANVRHGLMTPRIISAYVTSSQNR